VQSINEEKNGGTISFESFWDTFLDKRKASKKIKIAKMALESLHS
jgi:hypothetical protein